MTKEELEKENSALKNDIHTWKEASSTNSYKAFQLQEENKTLSMHIVELQNDKGELVDKCKELEKENAELKKFVNAPHTKGRKTSRGDYIKTVWDLSKQLTKAKVCLEQLVSEITVGELEVDPNILQQAEQLLNSEVGK